MANALRGKLLFIATGSFVVGILWGTILQMHWEYFAFCIFGAVLCFVGFLLTESFGFLVMVILLVVFPFGVVRAGGEPPPHYPQNLYPY